MLHALDQKEEELNVDCRAVQLITWLELAEKYVGHAVVGLDQSEKIGIPFIPAGRAKQQVEGRRVLGVE